MINDVFKEEVEHIIAEHKFDELYYGGLIVEDIIDDLNFVISKCPVKEELIEICVKQIKDLYEEGIIDCEDRDYIISQLYV
jgi:hypothetical protein